MKEIVSICIGQAGLQMGQSLWEGYCNQFAIDQSGNPLQKSTSEFHQNEKENTRKNVLFHEVSSGRYVPRAHLFDSDPTTVDEMKNSSPIFAKQQFVNGKQSYSTFSSGYYEWKSRQYIDESLDRIRLETERCDSFQGFLLHHSICGGTGSGYASCLIQRLSVNYGKKQKFSFCVYPSKQTSNLIVEPYNSIFSTHSLLQHSDLTFPITNQSLFDIHSNQLNQQSPFYRDINETISKICTSIVKPLCKEFTPLPMSQISTNLVPYPRLHFIASSFAPFLSKDNQYIERPELSSITSAAFDKSNFILDFTPDNGKYIATHLLYQGNLAQKEIIKEAQNIKGKIRFVDWIQTGMKVSLDNLKIPSIKQNNKQLCVLANSTSITGLFSRINHKFDLMYAKRAFMEQDEFSEAREDLAALEKDFEEGGIQDDSYQSSQYG